MPAQRLTVGAGLAGRDAVARSTTVVVRRVAVLCLVLLAFGCQTYRLGSQSLWYDEAVTARVASQGLAELTRWTADDIQPPLYYYVAAGWIRLAGSGEWALRFPSTFFGVLIVPLMWAMARRLYGPHRVFAAASWIAALLAALSPLYTYYAQEARMYTQLTALGLLSGYCLLRAMAAGRTTPGSAWAAAGWWAGFTAASAAALYTHYFAAFLLLAYACFYLVRLLVDRPVAGAGGVVARIAPALLSSCAVGLLYLPWLPAMLNRLAVDRSYWQGSFKLVAALRHLALSFTLGAPETMLEIEAIRWLPWFGAAFAICCLALLFVTVRGAPAPSAGVEDTRQDSQSAASPGKLARPFTFSPLLFFFLMLVVPALCVLLLASRSPKFNPRYLMLISPAYLLLMAGGISALLSFARCPASERQPGEMPARAWPGRLVAACGAAILLLGVLAPARSQQDWLAGDPAFTKAQWREVAAAVRRGMEPGEAVLLVSGHAAPAWDYYAPDIPAIRLPAIDVLDVQAVLGFDTGTALSAALAGKTGAWLVSWQDQVLDPIGMVPFYLDRAGSETPVKSSYWQLGLRRWRLHSDADYPTAPQPQNADGANFDHRLALLGWDAPRDGALTLYWQALNPLANHDYQVSMRFEDEAGRELPQRWDGRPAGYLYPTDRWAPGRPLFGRYPLPEGLSAGRYYATVAVYEAGRPSGLDIMDVADNPAGKRVRLGPFEVGQ